MVVCGKKVSYAYENSVLKSFDDGIIVVFDNKGEI